MKLRFALFLLASFLWTPFSYAEEVRRLENETLEDFAKRNGPPQAELTHKVIETEAWGQQKTVMAFYSVAIKLKDGTPATQVDGYLFMPKSTDTYEKILIGNFEEEGDTPKIEAVFFANADKDKAKELIVICSWLQRHYDVSGTLYGTFVFDDLCPGTNPTKLRFLEGVSERVSGDCDCEWRGGKKRTSKYKTAANVKPVSRSSAFDTGKRHDLQRRGQSKPMLEIYYRCCCATLTVPMVRRRETRERPLPSFAVILRSIT